MKHILNGNLSAFIVTEEGSVPTFKVENNTRLFNGDFNHLILIDA